VDAGHNRLIEESPDSVPVIDISALADVAPDAELPADNAGVQDLVGKLRSASTRFGFFQILGHGVSADLLADVWAQTTAFFALTSATKRQIERTPENTRGYYDRELTKNRRDLKEVLDLAQVPYPELASDHRLNSHAVDGVNQWPDLDQFEVTMVSYMSAVERIAYRLLSLFSLGFGGASSLALHRHFQPVHTSFLRLNHYPLHDPLAGHEARDVTDLGDMALHHHSDAGALTILLQDDVGGLQVRHKGNWIDVDPIAGALVVNTGDVIQVWSNDTHHAAVHRVAPVTDRPRFSLPYFFNPAYETSYGPLATAIAGGDRAHYRAINWGDFRQARADGDYDDYGAEIQISDYAISENSDTDSNLDV
jgi:isopenicillin N synthase-like dioxygenase